MMKAYLKPLLGLSGQLFFPAYCLSCREPTDAYGTLCPSCFQSLHMLSEPLCNQCSQPFEYRIDDQNRCETCIYHPPAFDRARAIWKYDQHSAGIIKKLKFGDKTQLAPHLGLLMKRHSHHLIAQASIITPVPLHRIRLRERKYNQSMLLASYIAKGEKPALIPDLLYRTRHTRPQAGLGYVDREQNVEGVFALNPRYRQRIEGEHVLLVDDVMTTGSTLHSCAYTLKQAGAAWVGVLTLAKRLLEDEELLDDNL